MWALDWLIDTVILFDRQLIYSSGAQARLQATGKNSYRPIQQSPITFDSSDDARQYVGLIIGK